MRKFLLFCVLFPLYLSVASCSWLDTNEPKKIKYEVTGTVASVNITMNNSGGNTEQLTGISIPWNKEFSIGKIHCHNPYSAYISAKNNNSSGRVTANIYVDGKLFQTATSTGAYVIATASGMIENKYECTEEYEK